MSIGSGITSALSALSLNARRLGAVADNVANVATDGYKAVDVRASTVTTSQSGEAYAPGGVTGFVKPSVAHQGLLQSTTSATDLAISGRGFFAVDTPGGPVRFTRAGSFAPDADGNLVNSAGFRLLGHATDAGGDVASDALAPINLNRIGGTADATGTVRVSANLPADAKVGDAVSIDVQIRDSLGNPLNLSLSFEKTGTNRYILGIADPTGATGATREGDAGGGAYQVDAYFNGDGSLAGFDADQDGTIDGSAPPDAFLTGLSTGAADQAISLDLDGLTQFAGGYQLGGVSADGARYGNVSGVNVRPDGAVTALFDNGERRTVAKVPLATFSNPDGLSRAAGGAYGPTDASGEPLYGAAGAGSIQSSALELSTTDIGGEFVRAIVAETAYRFAAKVVRTGDDMSKTLMDIKA